jgi:alkylation response protein AidB-like acyl-CoA dehydrogenase
VDYAERYDLPQDAAAWRDRARAFAQDVVAPLSRDMDREGRLRPDVVRRMGEAGLLAAPLPKESGGSAAGALSSALVSEELGRVDGSVRGFFAVQTCLVAQTVALEASPGPRRRWAEALGRGAAVGCFALTEPEAGSDVAALSTRVEPDGDGVRLTGEKHWITNGLTADVALVFATREPGGGRGSLEAWLCPTDAPGLRREPMPGRELGHRACDHGRLLFEGVRLPAEDRVGPERDGFAVAMRALERGRLSVAAGAVGIQAACLDACVSFARSRRQFGSRVGDFQQVGAALADLRAALEASRLLVHHAARRVDRGHDASADVSVAKLFATEAALAAATRAVRLHGARGYSDALPLERHYRDAVALTVYEGTSEIQRLILSRDLLGRDGARPPSAAERPRPRSGEVAR